jgi:proteasome lid subunit RPN8/RPN11
VNPSRLACADRGEPWHWHAVDVERRPGVAAHVLALAATSWSNPRMPTVETRESTLVLPPAQRDQLERLARAVYPLEACGMLLGERDETGARVVAVRRARNVVAEHAGDRYEIDPAEHLALEHEAQALGLAVIGVWHSHPDRPARPSELDRASACEGWSYLIVALTREGVADLRSWRLLAGELREERLSS